LAASDAGIFLASLKGLQLQSKKEMISRLLDLGVPHLGVHFIWQSSLAAIYGNRLQTRQCLLLARRREAVNENAPAT
jgi:hypothetical protein